MSGNFLGVCIGWGPTCDVALYGTVVSFCYCMQSLGVRIPHVHHNQKLGQIRNNKRARICTLSGYEMELVYRIAFYK